MSEHESVPNLKLLLSLRNLGYNFPYSFAEFIDNSIDANATNIQLRFDSKLKQILIVDDGDGMSFDTLKEAMRLASDTGKVRANQLGTFGMGLNSAMLSMAKKMTVITQRKNGPIYNAIMDTNAMIANNTWKIPMGIAEKKEEEIFNSFQFKHGTVIILEDFIAGFNMDKVSKDIRKPLGQIFRKFIGEERHLYVIHHDGQPREYCHALYEINPVDPLELDKEYGPSRIYFEDTLQIHYKQDGVEFMEPVRVKMVILPNLDYITDKKLKSKIGYNIAGQGFYVLRNSRELFPAKTMGLFVKHNSLNRFRAEINFSANMDDILALTFNKRSAANIMREDNTIEVNSSTQQSFMDALSRELESHIKAINAIIDAEQSKVDEKPTDIVIEEDQKIIEALNTQTSRFQDITKKELEAVRPGDVLHPTTISAPKQKINREIPSVETYTVDEGKIISIKYQAMGVADRIYYTATHGRGKNVTIIWNTSHPFYGEMSKLSMHAKKVIYALIYGYARVEHIYVNDDIVQQIDDIHVEASLNVRKLLS